MGRISKCALILGAQIRGRALPSQDAPALRSYCTSRVKVTSFVTLPEVAVRVS